VSETHRAGDNPFTGAKALMLIAGAFAWTMGATINTVTVTVYTHDATNDAHTVVSLGTASVIGSVVGLVLAPRVLARYGTLLVATTTPSMLAAAIVMLYIALTADYGGVVLLGAAEMALCGVLSGCSLGAFAALVFAVAGRSGFRTLTGAAGAAGLIGGMVGGVAAEAVMRGVSVTAPLLVAAGLYVPVSVLDGLAARGHVDRGGRGSGHLGLAAGLRKVLTTRSLSAGAVVLLLMGLVALYETTPYLVSVAAFGSAIGVPAYTAAVTLGHLAGVVAWTWLAIRTTREHVAARRTHPQRLLRWIAAGAAGTIGVALLILAEWPRDTAFVGLAIAGAALELGFRITLTEMQLAVGGELIAATTSIMSLTFAAGRMIGGQAQGLLANMHGPAAALYLATGAAVVTALARLLLPDTPPPSA